ncbi:MAG: DUF2892 domain-containing protein [Syntrophomonadaceae bacterium]|nr:DUF2892 domain-containing protein [Syntrophomonadaceae bacterium]
MQNRQLTVIFSPPSPESAKNSYFKLDKYFYSFYQIIALNQIKLFIKIIIGGETMIHIHKNAALLDRIIRFILSLAFFGLGLFGTYSPLWQAIFLLLGTAELLTSATGY